MSDVLPEQFVFTRDEPQAVEPDASPAQPQPTGDPTSGTNFVERAIDVTLQLGQGAFGEGGFNTVKLSGLRVSVDIHVAGAAAPTTANARIFGMTLDQMNACSTLGLQQGGIRNNRVMIEAGTVGGQMSTVFIGRINDAYADFRGMPEVPFVIAATVQFYESMVPTEPTSFSGAVDVATLMASLAQRSNLLFENHGVDVKLHDSYFPGTIGQQIDAVAAHANIGYTIETGWLIIWPKGGSRGGGDQVPTITPTSGLIGYPSYTSTGLVFDAVYDPSVAAGKLVKVESPLKGGSGTFRVATLDYALDAQVPGGNWMMTIQATATGETLAALTQAQAG